MEIIIDKIAIWRGGTISGTQTRTAPAGIRVAEKSGILMVASKPVLRVAKNYKKGKTEFVLFVRTYRTDTDAIVKELDKVAKTITEKEAKDANEMVSYNDFRYLNESIGE